MICCESLTSQMSKEFRRVAREGQAASSASSSPLFLIMVSPLPGKHTSPLFLFPFFLNLPLREQSLLPQSGGAGGEHGGNELENFSLRVVLHVVSPVALTPL